MILYLYYILDFSSYSKYYYKILYLRDVKRNNVHGVPTMCHSTRHSTRHVHSELLLPEPQNKP